MIIHLRFRKDSLAAAAEARQADALHPVRVVRQREPARELRLGVLPTAERRPRVRSAMDLGKYFMPFPGVSSGTAEDKPGDSNRFERLDTAAQRELVVKVLA